jgi:predicted ATPase
LLAVEGLIEAELALGHHRDVVPDLEQLVTEYPYREFLWRSLMLALYRSDRVAAALRVYHRLRTTLVDEFGLEPSSEAQELEHRILDQDPALDLRVGSPRTNLPVPLDSFVDRVAERSSLTASLETHRFVTVLGIGGVGKSRLANEVGQALLEHTPGGVWWIDLAAEREAVSFVALTASAMGLSVSPAGNAETVLLAHLRRAPTLLVLDNCEHLTADTTAFVGWVTSNAPLVRVLATSRALLDVPGAQRLVLEPLAVGTGGGSQLSEAGRLFVDRLAERIDVGPLDAADADAIVQLVGGLPLGIELAAAQCVTTTPNDLARALQDRDVLLSMSDMARDDDRHANLRRVLDLSLEAIQPSLARQLSRLGVFPGDFELDGAAAVLGLPRSEAERSITQLLSASLLSRSSTDAPHRRFRLLWPIRELVIDRLSDDERGEAEMGHARHFQVVAQKFLQDADTPAEPERLELISTDQHNVAAALRWFEAHEPDGALVFAPALGLFHQLRGDQHEGSDLLRRLLAEAQNAPASHIAWTEESLTWPEFLAGDIGEAITHNEDAIARFEALGDPRGLSRALRARAHAFHLSGVAETTTTPIYQRSIEVARAADLVYSVTLSQVQFAHALTAFEQFDVIDVDAMLSEAEEILHRHHDHANLAHAALSRGFIAFSRDDTIAQRTAGDNMLRQSRLARAPIWKQMAMVLLAVTAHQEGSPGESRRWFHDAVHLARDTDNQAQLGVTLHALAAASADRAPEDAARIWGVAGTLTPTWPLFDRRYGEWLDVARRTLGVRFDALVAQGAALGLDDAVALADSLT